jgi:FAD dependent oxidoreductase
MKFFKKYDVVVAGGGIAGVAAAVAAARRGMSTALVEKTVFAGGLATTGIVYIYLPLCDGNGTQVTFGLAEELLHESIKYGPGDIYPDWAKGKNAGERKRYMVRFSPASYILALDEIMVNAGVDIWYDTLITDVTVNNDTLESIEVCNKSGKGIISTECFVDATGDADLAHFAGLNCPVEDNALAIWAIEHLEEDIHPNRVIGRNTAAYQGGGSNAPRMGQPGINGKLVSEFILKGREKYRERLAASYTSDKHDRKSHFPIKLPAMAQFRMTRRIDGQFTLADGMEWTPFEDSIGLAADWRKSGYVWEVPYRSLVPEGIKGLLAAGRCIASAGDAWDVMRVIPVAALTGEAAGVAAALSIEHKISPDELDYKILQHALTEGRNFPLHFADIGLKK